MSQNTQHHTGFLGPQPTNLPQAGQPYANPASSTFSGFQQPNFESHSTTSTNYQPPGLQPQQPPTTFTGFQQPVWQPQTTSYGGYQPPSLQPQNTTYAGYQQPNMPQQQPPTQYQDSVIVSTISNITTRPPPTINNEWSIITFRGIHYLRTPEGYMRYMIRRGDLWFVQEMAANLEAFAPCDTNDNVASLQGQVQVQHSTNPTGQIQEQAPPNLTGYGGLQSQGQVQVNTNPTGQGQEQAPPNLRGYGGLQSQGQVQASTMASNQDQGQMSSQLLSQDAPAQRPADLLIKSPRPTPTQLRTEGPPVHQTTQMERRQVGVVTKAMFDAKQNEMSPGDASLLRQWFANANLDESSLRGNQRLQNYIQTGNYEYSPGPTTRFRTAKRGGGSWARREEEGEL